MASDSTPSRLLALPDPCLLAVMQCCADDAGNVFSAAAAARSVLSAAAAHSRLQRAAVSALSRISVYIPAEGPNQKRVSRLLLYLAKHGQHVRSLALRVPYGGLWLRELPRSLTKLDSLLLEGMTPLQPDVLRAGFPLARLELNDCRLFDATHSLAAVLAQLPDLQHLSVAFVYDDCGRATLFTDVLSRLTQLTSLQLDSVECHNSSSGSGPGAALQPLQALTRLADLQLSRLDRYHVTANVLSGAGQLTRLVVSEQLFEPRSLAGKSQLQHLSLQRCSFAPGTGVAQLLSELQHLTQLTHLDLSHTCRQTDDLVGPNPPPAAYASLTASSRLQHLDFNNSTLASAAWQYMCPPGRTLLQLRYLDISRVKEADGSQSVPDTSALVSCCPGLQSLKTSMPCSTAQSAPLQRLTGLHTLAVGAAGGDDDLEGVQVLCQLTGLQQLELRTDTAPDARLLQLTHLTRLTALTFRRGGSLFPKSLRSHSQDPGSEPVWRKLLQRLVASPDAEVAQQAAAALAAV